MLQEIYVTMTFCLVLVMVYAVLGYIYSHNVGSESVLTRVHNIYMQTLL